MSIPVRLGLYYAAIYAGAGVSLPYIAVWFAARGLSGAQIGLILSAPMLAWVVTAPALALWADGFRLRRTPLIFIAAGAAGLYALLAAPIGFLGWALAWFGATSLLTTLTPLMDVITLTRARRDGFNYGWPRGLGSAAFILGNVAMGGLLTQVPPVWIVVWVAAAAGLTALAARALLPPDPVHAESEAARAAWRERLAGLGELTRDRVFMLAVVSVGLIQATHAFYYGFSTLAWKAQGLPESLTGLLWGFAVAVEIGFMWFMEPWRRRMGPSRLLTLGGAAAAVRWTALAFSPPLGLLFPLQALHALSFAATFMASLQLVERLSNSRNASAAQTLNSALSGGLISGVATLASGWLFDHAGAHGYLAMAAMALTGLIGAFWLSRSPRIRG